MLIVLSSSLFGISWAISSPPGSAADEIYHLGSIWCAWGEDDICLFDGEAQDNGRRNITLTSGFSKAGCFRSDIDKENKSAKCYLQNSQNQERFAWEMNSGNYPGLTYSVLRIFASNNIELSVMIMRFFNYSLFTFLCILALFTLSRENMYASYLAFLITIIPVSIFFMTSINPTSWSITGIGFYWVFLWNYFSKVKNSIINLNLISLIVCAILVIGSRSDSAAYLVVISVLVIFSLLIQNRIYNERKKILIVTIINIWAIIQFSYNSQFRAESKSINSDSGLNLFFQNLLELPNYYLGIFGGAGPAEWPFGLGWFDTPIPKIVPTIGIINVILVVLLFKRNWNIQQKIFLITLPFFMFLIPTIILQLRQSSATFFLQPRYLIPLVIVFLGSLVIESKALINVKLLTSLLIFNVAIANSISLFTNIKRYSLGLDSQLNFFQSYEWWWDIPLTPGVTWVVGSVSFPIFMLLLFSKILNQKIYSIKIR